MAFAKFQENRFRIDGEIAENHAILVNLTASIITTIVLIGWIKVNYSIYNYYVKYKDVIFVKYFYKFLFMSNSM